MMVVLLLLFKGSLTSPQLESLYSCSWFYANLLISQVISIVFIKETLWFLQLEGFVISR